MLVSRGGLGGRGAQPRPGSSRPSLCPPAWGLQPPQLPPSFPCSPGHNEQPRGVPAATLPQAGWSQPSFPLTLCFPRAGGQASCSPGPSLHASGHGVTSKCGRGARAPHPAPSLGAAPQVVTGGDTEGQQHAEGHTASEGQPGRGGLTHFPVTRPLPLCPQSLLEPANRDAAPTPGVEGLDLSNEG